MTSTDAYEQLEATIYEAAVVPELWPAALAGLSAYSGTAGSLLLCVNERGVQVANSPNMDEIVRRFHAENWMARNARAAALVARGFVGLPRFVTEQDVFEPGGELTDPMIQELFRPAGFGRGAGIMVDLPHGDTIIVSVEQYWERGPIRGEERTRLDSFYPHLARAGMLAARGDLQRVRTAVETMSAMGLPAAAVTPSGRVVLANEEFAAASDIWTTRGRDGLALHDQIADRLVAEALANVTRAEGTRSIPIRLVSGGPVSAVLQLIPIRRSGFDIFGSSAAIAVISRPGASPGTNPKLVQSLFDLTPAELAIATSLAAGSTVAEIAAANGRSINTVRNQLSSIMAKTGCSRQVELIVLMNQLSGRANAPAPAILTAP